MKQFGLNKRHKLCSLTAIDALFKGEGSSSGLAYPLRAVWRVAGPRRENDDVSKFLVSVPKKKLRHAVDRVAMRRRVREAYRLWHKAFEDGASQSGIYDIAFIYVADRQRSYSSVEASMKRLLRQIYPPSDTPVNP